MTEQTAEPTLEEKARDIHDALTWPDDLDGQPHKWGTCDDEHRQPFRDAILRHEATS